MKYSKHLLLFILALFILNTACSHTKIIPLYTEKQAPAKTALLTTPIQVELIYHNGEKTNISPAYHPLVKYRLIAGKQLLGFRYQDVHYDDEGNHEVITSKNVFVSFEAEAGGDYILDYAKPANYSEAKQFEEVFQLTLTKNNQRIAISTDAAGSIENQSFISDEKFTPEIKNLFDKDDTSPEDKSLPPKSDDNPLYHLKYWWENASSSEQADFDEWKKGN